MVSLLHKYLQACCNGPHLMTTPKIVHRSPGSHNKVIARCDKSDLTNKFSVMYVYVFSSQRFRYN